MVKTHITVIKAKGADKVYKNIVRSTKQRIDFRVAKCMLLASRGFVKGDCFKFMMEQAIHQDGELLLENMSKLILHRALSGHEHALDEVLIGPPCWWRVVHGACGV